MEFWGVELKPNQTLKCVPGEEKLLHLSLATLAESKKSAENVVLYVTFNNQKLVIGTLSAEKCPQINHDLIFEKEFELSHNSKNATVHFTGYKSLQNDDVPSDFDDFSLEDEEEDKVASKPNGLVKLKPEPEKEDIAQKAKAVKPIKAEQKDMEDEEDESDDDEEFYYHSSENEEEIPYPPRAKKRQAEAAKKSAEPEKKEYKLADGKKGGEAKKGTTTPAKGEKSDKGKHPTEDESDDDEDDYNIHSSENEDEIPDPPRTKKRQAEAAKKSAEPEKEYKLTDGKKGGEAKKGTTTPAKGEKSDKGKQQTPKSAGSVSCKSCSKTFNSEGALESHTKAKHSAK